MLAAPALAACGGRVQSGNGASTLALAQRCGTTVGDLRRANPNLDLNNRLNGQIIKVPNARKRQYIPDSVKRGAPPASSVLSPVPHSHPAIRPQARRKPTDYGQSYVIRRGDTLSAIASTAGVALETLIAANPNVDPHRLAVGQTISVPGAR